MTNDLSGRLIALRDRWRAIANDASESPDDDRDLSVLMADKLYAETLRRCADELDELITALLRPQLQENTEEETTDDPRNRASVLRSETEPTR